MYQKPRLYIKHHFRHPQVIQSVAIDQSTDGLKRKTLFLTVFTSVARVPFFYTNMIRARIEMPSNPLEGVS